MKAIYYGDDYVFIYFNSLSVVGNRLYRLLVDLCGLALQLSGLLIGLVGLPWLVGS